MYKLWKMLLFPFVAFIKVTQTDFQLLIMHMESVQVFDRIPERDVYNSSFF